MHPRPALPFLLAALSACSVAGRCDCLPWPKTGETTGGSDDGGPSEPHESTVEPDRPAARVHVAKVRAGAQCPEAPAGWTLEPGAQGTSPPLDQRRGRYCAYVAEGSEGTPSPAFTLQAPSHTVEHLEADYARVLPQSSAAGSIPPEDRFERFLEQHGTVVLGPAAPPDAQRPFVAIVDTADADGSWSLGGRQPREHHGMAMAGLVSALRCPASDPTCDRSRLLFEQAFPPDVFASAGHEDVEARGSVWSLDRAVVRAVERWAQTPEPRPPLVLNMSVGWEWSAVETELLANNRSHLLQGLEGLAHPSLSPTEEALFLTLSWASCQGVLSIAAAGNTRTGACKEVGPMAPAAWEAVRGPSRQECIDAFGIDPGASYSQGPLVYAAGGIDAQQHAIVNARAGGVPARVLYATQTPSLVDGDHTVPWTGTSVATASLSALAARLWADTPGSGPHEIMAKIDTVGLTIDPAWVADVVPLGAPRPPVREIRASLVLPARYQATPTSTPSLSPSFLTSLSPSPSSSVLALAPDPDQTETCPGRAVSAYTFGGATSPSGLAWPELHPQPDTAICLGCPLVIDDHSTTVTISIDAAGRTIASPTAVLELYEVQGQQTQVTRVDLDVSRHCPSGALAPATCTVPLADYADPSGTPNLSLADFLEASGVHSARMMFLVSTVDAQGTTTVQLVGNEIDVQRV